MVDKLRLTKTNMNQENKEVKSNENPIDIMQNQIIDNAEKTNYPMKPFTPQSLEEKGEESPFDVKSHKLHCAQQSGDCICSHPPTDSNWNWQDDFREYFDKTLKPKKPTMGGLDREICIDFINKVIQSERKEVIGKHNAHILNEWQLKGFGDERVLFPILEKATEISLSSNKPSNE